MGLRKQMNTLVPATKNISCPHCKAEDVAIVVYSDTVDFRNMELDVENLQKSLCRNCGHKWTTRDQRAHNNSVMRDTYAIVRDDLRKKHGLLSSKEITRLREAFTLNQREAAALFGGGYNAFNKYESGEVLQSYAMDRLLRLSAAVGTPAIEFLQNVFSPPNFIVITTNIPNEVRVTIGGGGMFNRTQIRGTSETSQIEQDRNAIIEFVGNKQSLPVAHEEYSVTYK